MSVTDPLGNPTLAALTVPDGSRNVELTREAGRLHDGTRTLEELERCLQAVNEARCEPPLPRNEVRKIAGSIHRREPCKPSKGKPPEEVTDFVSRHRSGVLHARAWKGQAGATDRKVYAALLDVAEEHGRLHESGNVIVSVSVRALAGRAGCGHPAAKRSLTRLQEQTLLYRVPTTTGPGRCGVLVLRDQKATQGEPIQQTDSLGGLNGINPRKDVSETLRRFRHGGGITPTMALHVEALMLAGGSATVPELANRLKRRKCDVRRTLRKLEQRGVVRRYGNSDHFAVARDIEAALHRALEEDGVPERERAQRVQHERDRLRYRYHHEERSRATREKHAAYLKRKATVETSKRLARGEVPEGWTRGEADSYKGFVEAGWKFTPEEYKAEQSAHFREWMEGEREELRRLVNARYGGDFERLRADHADLVREDGDYTGAEIHALISAVRAGKRCALVLLPGGIESGEAFGESSVLVKNLPPKGADGIYRHGPECACWMCDEDAPEYVPAAAMEAVA